MVPPRVDENSARIAKQYAASFPLPPRLSWQKVSLLRCGRGI
jgi:hypothetical protein